MWTRLLASVLVLLSIVTLALWSVEQQTRITTLDRSVTSLRDSLAALDIELAGVASSTANSTANLALDVAKSAHEQAPALKSQGSELPNAVAAVTPAVVSIVEQDLAGNTLAGGTGFFVRSSGYIVTNRHVVADDGVAYNVVLASGADKPATVVWRSPDQDIAVIKIAGSGYPTATLGDAGALVLGDSVFAVGNALGRYGNSVSVGVVSGLTRIHWPARDTHGRHPDRCGYQSGQLGRAVGRSLGAGRRH